MAIKTITTFVRPTANVPFFSSNEHTAIVEAYKTAGKITGSTVENSGDSLTRIQTRTFATVEAQQEFKNDTARDAFKVARREYNTANGIVMTVEYVTA